MIIVTHTESKQGKMITETKKFRNKDIADKYYNSIESDAKQLIFRGSDL